MDDLAIPDEIKDKVLNAASDRKGRKFKGRAGTAAEYDSKGKLLPVNKWIGVTGAAKRMTKKLMRAGHSQEKTDVVDQPINSAAEAWASMRERKKRVKQLNTEMRERKRDLAVGATREQTMARARHDADLLEKNKPVPKTVYDYTPEQGGPFVTSALVPIKDTGYLGVELRAIRRERGIGRSLA